jgi:hypothetical protein
MCLLCRELATDVPSDSATRALSSHVTILYKTRNSRSFYGLCNYMDPNDSPLHFPTLVITSVSFPCVLLHLIFCVTEQVQTGGDALLNKAKDKTVVPGILVC